MSSRVRIVIHAFMAAGALALVGMMFAELASLWVSGREVPREGLPAAEPVQIGSEVRWRLPLAMAAMGFVLVIVGEGLWSLWRKSPVQPAPAPRDFDREAEAKIQAMLRDTEPPSSSPPGPAGPPSSGQQT
jgi:hypothetical protein